MKHCSRPPKPDEHLRPRRVDLIELRHELVQRATLIDREVFKRKLADFLPSSAGRVATSPRLVAELLYLQPAFRLADAAVVVRRVENPYHQPVTGATFSTQACHRPVVLDPLARADR